MEVDESNQKNPRSPVHAEATGISPRRMTLDLAPEDYVIVTVGDRVSIRERASGQLVYAGIGPVEISVSSAPF